MISQKLTAFVAAGILAVACGPASTAQAQDQYAIDPVHTHVQFSVLRFGFNDVIASFPDVKGVIFLDEETPENSSVEVEIGVASLVSGDDGRNEALHTPFWLNSGEFPTMIYRSVKVEQLNETGAEITGELTLLGVTKPVVMHVVLNKIGKDPATKKDAVGFSATASLNRSDFGLMTAGKLVGDEISIRIETLAHKME